MTVESRLTDVEDRQRNIRNADRLQNRRVSATAPTDKQVMMWNGTTKKWEPVTGAQVLFARATSSLTLTNSYQSIVGDGNSTKVRLLLPTIGDWLVEAVCDFHITTAAANQSCIGSLFVDDSGSEESGSTVKEMEAKDRATVTQRWKVTVTAANTPVELKAKKDTAGGVAVAQATQTTLVAAIGIGGGSVAAASDHGALTGLGDASDHAYAILKNGTRDFTGEQSMGTNKLTNVVDPTANQDAATKKYVDDNEYTDSDAITAVPFIEYIPFGSEPITGQSYAP